MKNLFKVDAYYGNSLQDSQKVIYINPDLLGDTVFEIYDRYYKLYNYKIEYEKNFLFLTEECFNSLLVYFKSIQRNERIGQILN